MNIIILKEHFAVPDKIVFFIRQKQYRQSHYFLSIWSEYDLQSFKSFQNHTESMQMLRHLA
jgi:hypothetical protein